MADDPNMDGPGQDPALPKGAQNTLRNMGFSADAKAADTTPTYKMVGDSKIAISKYHGKVWKNRKETAEKILKDNVDAWKEAISYHNADQQSHRNSTEGVVSGNISARQRINDVNSETENIVFANVATMIPAIYAKNPDIEFTPTDDANGDHAELIEKVVNALLVKKVAPGVNLKPKVKKAITMALLTNEAWACLDWVTKEDSTDQAMQDLATISQKLEKAKNSKEIEELEGQLQALDDSVAMLSPPGCLISTKMPWEVLTDPTAVDDDFTDATWQMYSVMLSWTFVRAKYAEKDSNGNYKSVYEPTHILASTSSEGIQDQINNFTLFNTSTDNEWSKMGFDDKTSYDAAKYCKCWYIWDKSTRRVYLYHDKYWTWPLWVWDDPYKLDRFFNLFRLNFHTSPDKTRSKGEVSYYLDQQDAINEINDEEARARLWAKRHIFYDKNSIKDATELEKFLKGVDNTAFGIDIPDGKKVEDILGSVKMPSMSMKDLFNVDRKLQAIDRISSVSDIMRGAQFKTNTTNQAVETYNSITNQRIDERIDSVEDFVGDIGWGITQLVLQFMTAEEVASLIGQNASAWQNMAPEEISAHFNMQVVGGSSAKPTSENKKKQAVQVGQVLGQFAQSAPAAVLKVTLKMFQRAFDEVEVDDWGQIDQEAEAQLQRGSSMPGQPGQPQQPQGDIPPEIQAEVQKLPPPIQQAFMAALQKGVPPDKALQLIQQELQQRGGGQPNGAGPPPQQ
jgi:hypothetical protein